MTLPRGECRPVLVFGLTSSVMDRIDVEHQGRLTRRCSGPPGAAAELFR
jgi:hypothetical protein